MSLHVRRNIHRAWVSDVSSPGRPIQMSRELGIVIPTNRVSKMLQGINPVTGQTEWYWADLQVGKRNILTYVQNPIGGQSPGGAEE